MSRISWANLTIVVQSKSTSGSRYRASGCFMVIALEIRAGPTLLSHWELVCDLVTAGKEEYNEPRGCGGRRK